MPPTMVGPHPFIDPPCALSPLVVWNSCAVLKSQITVPLRESCARMRPSSEPAKTTPGITVGGAICAALHPKTPTQAGFGGAEYQACLPVRKLSANNPPPTRGLESS